MVALLLVAGTLSTILVLNIDNIDGALGALMSDVITGCTYDTL